ncbi:MAG: Uma2 family endonuclease [Bacteroidota bacterium]
MQSTSSMPQVQERLINVDEYYKMAEHGIIKHDEKVELIYGKIIKMSPSTSRHAACIDRIVKLFYRNEIDNSYSIRSQSPIRLNDLSEPEPDVSVLKFEESSYDDRHPAPGEIFVLIEVALSSLYVDRVIKASLYAEANIPEYWVINLNKNEIEVYTKPYEAIYQKCTIFKKGEVLTSSFLDLAFNTDKILI